MATLISPNLKKIHTLFESRGYKDNDEVDSDNSNITLKQLRTICSIPIWWTDKEIHEDQAREHPGECCFHHFLGLEQKYNEFKTPHAGLLKCIDIWNRYKASVIWKFGGMAVTTTGEYFLPFKAIASYAPNIVNSDMGIIVGPRLRLASKMLDSIRLKFKRKQGIIFADNATILRFPPPNNVTLEIYPSNIHVDAIRSIKKFSYLWFDEGDFISKNQIFQMLDALERNILKSRAHVIIVSTPNKPDHMLDTIERNYSNSYYIEKFDVWTWGIDTCYSMEEIREAQKRRSFPREFECKFLGNEGNVFSQGDIERAYQLGLQHCRLAPQVAQFYPHDLDNKILDDPAVMQYLTPDYNMPVYGKSIGEDPAHGSSEFAIVITAVRDYRWIDVLYAKKFRRSSPAAMLRLTKDLATIYRGNKIHVDGNAAGFTIDLKREFHEDNRENLYPNLTVMRDPEIQRNKVIPVNFRAMHRLLLQHAHGLVNKGIVRIHPIFRDLRIAMESATATEWDLDKDETVYDDLLDAFMLSLIPHQLGVKKPGYVASI